jgi:superfamily II DNA helicase RecQ
LLNMKINHNLCAEQQTILLENENRSNLFFFARDIGRTSLNLSFIQKCEFVKKGIHITKY